MPLLHFTVANDVQAVLFERFVLPHLTEGLFDQARPSNHAEPWDACLVHVVQPTGRTFYAPNAEYNLLRLAKDKQRALEMRACAYYAQQQGREAGMSLEMGKLIPGALDDVYSQQRLLAELRSLKKVMKVRLEEVFKHPPPTASASERERFEASRAPVAASPSPGGPEAEAVAEVQALASNKL